MYLKTHSWKFVIAIVAMKITGDGRTFHRGHTAEILERSTQMVCNGFKSASKLQENGPFHRIVWQGLLERTTYHAICNEEKT